MADFPTRPTWIRGLRSKITASTAVVTAGGLLTDDQGNAYIGDGVTQVKNLRRVVRDRDVVLLASSFGAKGDGVTADHTAINDAMTFLSTYGGGVVRLDVGTYRCTGPIVLKSGVRLEGTTGGGSVLSLDSATAFVGKGVITDGTTALTNCGVRDVVIDGRRSTYNQVNSGVWLKTPGHDGVTLERVTVKAAAYIGIAILGSTTRTPVTQNIRVTACTTVDTGGHGILLQAGIDQCWVENNRVIRHGQAFNDCPGITAGRYAYDVHVEGNYVDSTGALGASPNSISMDNCRGRWTCSNNTVVNGVGISIELGYSRDGVCSGNSVTGGARAGITLTADTNLSTNLGITITGNSLVGTNGGIISLQANTTTDMAAPANRTLRRSTPYTATVQTRTLYGTRLYQCTTAGTTDATAPAAYGNTATGDTVTDGTSVWTDKGQVCSQLAIIGNVIRDSTFTGVQLSYWHQFVIEGNVISGCAKSGIYIDSNSSMYTIGPNDLQNNNTSGDTAHGGVRIIALDGHPHPCSLAIGRSGDNGIINTSLYVTNSATSQRIDNRLLPNIATQTVAYSDHFNTSNTAATSMVGFTDANSLERRITIRVADTFTTFVHTPSGSNTLRLAGSVNWAAPANSVITFVWIQSLLQWQEVGRTLP